MDQLRANLPYPAGQHDWFVIAPVAAAGLALKDAKIASHTGTAKLIIEGSSTDGPLEHDFQR